MSRRRWFSLITAGLITGISLTAGAFLSSSNAGRIVTYQGRIDRDGIPGNGAYTMRFKLFTDTNPNVTTTCWTSGDLTVAVFDGVFSVALGPVDASCFASTVPALSVGTDVRGPGETAFTPLVGRQRFYPSPYAAGTPTATDFVVAGKIGLGTTAPAAALDVRQAWGSQSDPSQGLAAVMNTTNAADAHASLLLRTAGSGGGNPFISMDIASEAGWSMGIDNGDSNKFKIANSWSDLRTNTKLTIDPSGAISAVNGIPGNVLIGYSSGWGGGTPNNYIQAFDGDENTATGEALTNAPGQVGRIIFELSSERRGIAFIKMGVRTASNGTARFRVQTGSDSQTYSTVWDTGVFQPGTSERILTTAVPFYGRAIRIEGEDQGTAQVIVRIYEVSVKRYE